MSTIQIVGLGAGDIEQLPLGVCKKLISGDQPLFLRTKEHPVVAALEEEGVTYHSFDTFYEQHETFSEVYEKISGKLLSVAQQEDIVYAVPGHPLVAEQTVQHLLARAEENHVQLVFAGGQSFLDSIFLSLKLDPIEGFQLLDGSGLQRDECLLTQHLIISQVYDAFVASHVKLTLLEKLPFDYEIYVVTAAGSKLEEVKKIPLVELDRTVTLSNLTSLYIPPVQDETILNKEFSRLRAIIAELRGPNGCPWDKKQTHDSLKKYLLEETYELIEAIHEEDIDHIVEELGDVLLQVMLHAQIGEDAGFFTVADVIEGISAKMIRRHPHVFGNVKVESEEEVMQNWQQIKQTEKQTENGSI
ncbi:MazG family protein [Bacillaceae bacterium Marseille-Q3522]|nr:MazG family protein [Bacillaceae bacterium Marseille-Q3522]